MNRTDQRGGRRLLAAGCCVLMVMSLVGCRNPAQSTLPPSAVSQTGVAFPPLPKGDVYADETVVSVDTVIEVGDTLEVVIQRGAGEEKFVSAVRDSGKVNLAFVEAGVAGLSVAEAEKLIHAQFTPYMRSPHVQVQLKKKSLRVKRIFVFGDVRKPGMYPMSRNMTVLQALALADNYNETALLEEIRVVRGNLERPDIHVADLARLYTYGDWSRNLALQENDVVYVPREHLGDAVEASKKLMPVISAAIAPFYPAFFIPALTR